MPDFVKHSNGEIDWSKLFMGLAVALVLVLQQWQAYRIAEIKANGEIIKIQFITKEKVNERLNHMDKIYMKKDELLYHLKLLEDSHGVLDENK